MRKRRCVNCDEDLVMQRLPLCISCARMGVSAFSIGAAVVGAIWAIASKLF